MNTPGTSDWPVALDTPVTLIEVANLTGSTIAGTVAPGDLSIPMASVAGMPQTGVMVLTDSLSTPTKTERVIYTSIVGNNLIIHADGRGAFGSTAQSWSSGNFARIRMNAEHHQVLVSAMVAVQTFIGLGPDLPTRFDLKANLASPALTGIPTAPTAVLGTNTTQIATTAYVRGEINALVGAAPGTLDTLSELADALADDANFAATVTASLAGKAGLSVANVFTAAQGVNLSSSSAFFVGPNGDTNPTLRAVTNTASAATGVEVVGTAAGVGPFLRVISTGANECLIAVPKGTGNFIIFTGRLQFGGTAAGSGDRAIDSPSATLIRAVTGNGGAFLQFAARDFLISDATPGTSGVGVIAVKTTTVPTTSPVDVCQFYVQDSVAGRADWVMRNEAGDVARLSGLTCRASSQLDKTSDVALADIPGLTRDVKAGEILKFVAEIPTVSGSSGGIRFDVSGTATFTNIFYEAEVKEAGVFKVPGTTRATALNTVVGDIQAVTAARVTIVGYFVVNAAGTFKIRFAQHTSNATPSSALASSTLVMTPI